MHNLVSLCIIIIILTLCTSYTVCQTTTTPNPTYDTACVSQTSCGSSYTPNYNFTDSVCTQIGPTYYSMTISCNTDTTGYLSFYAYHGCNTILSCTPSAGPYNAIASYTQVICASYIIEFDCKANLTLPTTPAPTTAAPTTMSPTTQPAPNCTYGSMFSLSSGTCVPCPPGTYSSMINVTQCTQCTGGSYNPNLGSSTCSLCTPGKSVFSQGSTTCYNCDPGYMSNTNGSMQCIPCPPGTYNPSSMSSVCLSCAYNNTPAATICSTPVPITSTTALVTNSTPTSSSSSDDIDGLSSSNFVALVVAAGCIIVVGAISSVAYIVYSRIHTAKMSPPPSPVSQAESLVKRPTSARDATITTSPAFSKLYQIRR